MMRFTDNDQMSKQTIRTLGLFYLASSDGERMGADEANVFVDNGWVEVSEVDGLKVITVTAQGEAFLKENEERIQKRLSEQIVLGFAKIT